MTKIGKTAIRAVVGVAATALAIYADYRVKGGPPIRQLYRQVKAEREMREAGKPVVLTENEGYTVR